MIIKRLFINNFGCFRGKLFQWDDDFVLFCGENESGKTTLLEFVRRLFCGFPDRRHAVNHYLPPVGADGNYGGWAELLLTSGETVRLERYGLNGRAVLHRADGSVEEDGDEAFRRLTGISGEWYDRIYAVTIDELTDLSALENDTIRRNLYGAPVVGAGVSLPAVEKELANRAKALVKLRGSNSELGRLREEYEKCRSQLDAARQEQQQFLQMQKEYDELQLQLGQLRSALDGANKKIREDEEFMHFFRQHRQLEEVSAQLLPLPPLPEDEKSGLRQRHAGLLAEVKAAEAGCREVPEKTLSLPEIGEGEFRQAENLRQEAAQLREMPEGKALTAAGAALSAAAVITLFLPLPTVPKVIAALLPAAAGGAVLFSGIRRRRMRCAALRQNHGQIALFRRRFALPEELDINAFEAHLKLLAGDRRALLRRRAAAEALAGFYAALKVDGAAGFEALCRDLDRRRTLEEKLKLLRQGLLESAGDEKRFNLLAARCAVTVPEELEEKIADCREQISSLHLELDEKLRISGSLQSRMTDAAKADPDAVATRMEGLKGDIRRVLRDYLVLRGAAHLLELAVSRYEKESQPQVIRRAGELFTAFTGGRYGQLRKAVATGRLMVSDLQEDLEKEFAQLSRGTREQLMLAMRLALIDCREEKEEPLPLILDDVTVNFDSRRSAAVLETLRKFTSGTGGRKRQLFFFTCRDL